MLLLFWLFALPALALAALSLRGERERIEWIARRLDEAPREEPRAAVIVPVKGEDEGLRENLAALAALDYPEYELIVCARSAADIPPDVLPSGVKVTLSAAVGGRTGEKVQNLLAGLRSAKPGSLILAFADSDGRVRPGWLRALAAALQRGPEVAAATGYRFHLPAPPAGFASLLRSAWNAVIAGGFGPQPARFAWGGGMAIHREVFDQLRVAEFWYGSVSDDYGLSAAVRAAGRRIAFAPGAMVAARDHTGLVEFLGWARRQLTLTRVYDPPLWRMALIAHVLYGAGMAVCVAAWALWSSPAAVAALAGILAPGLFKGWNRLRIARMEFPEDGAWFRRYGWSQVLLVPLATWAWLGTLLASAVGRTIRWRGYTYRLRRPSLWTATAATAKE